MLSFLLALCSVLIFCVAGSQFPPCGLKVNCSVAPPEGADDSAQLGRQRVCLCWKQFEDIRLTPASGHAYSSDSQGEHECFHTTTDTRQMLFFTSQY